MKTTNDTNTAARYNLVRDVAARLGRNPLFEGGEKALCRLYANVPFRYVELDGTPLEDTSADLDGCAWEYYRDCVVDLLVCRSDSNEDALGIIFEYDRNRPTPPLDHRVTINPGFTPEAITEFIEKCVDSLLYDRLEPAFIPKFTLHTLPAEDLAGETGDALRAHLTRERLLLGDGSVTTYGRELGLLEQYGPDGSGRGWAAIQHKADALKEALSHGSMAFSGKTPLETRLKRLEDGLPGDKPYAAFLKQSLTSLLKTPLDFLCGGVPQVMATLEDELADAQSLLEHGGRRPARTYGDALGVVRDLYRGYWQSGLDRTEKTEKADAILMFLAKLLVSPPAPQYVKEQDAEPRSLKDRLSGLGAGPGVEYPILSVPVAHYYHAASILDGSNYPNWLCTDRFHIREKDKFKVDMAYMLKWYLGEIPGCKSDDILTHLYDLLVEPIFPDLDPNP